MSGWSTKKGIVAKEDASEYYPERSEGVTNINVRVLLKFDPKDSANQCTFGSHTGFNVSKQHLHIKVDS